jgi:hypothetical protein
LELTVNTAKEPEHNRGKASGLSTS